MNCAEVEPLIGASLDDELDPRSAVEIDSHTSTCASCRTHLAKLKFLKEEFAAADLDWSASADLRAIRSRIRRTIREPWWRRALTWRIAAGALVTGLLAVILVPTSPQQSWEREIVDSHIRSLLAEHLVDIPSSNQHTVKPWFQGRLSFAPTVADLSASGFELVGGRLDVLDGKSAAAIVYRRRRHLVNLWLLPTDQSDSPIRSMELEGFHLLQWRKKGISYWTASDLNDVELHEFAALIRSN